MEFVKLEIAVVEKTIADSVETQVRELDDLQLALIGGGVGEVILG